MDSTKTNSISPRDFAHVLFKRRSQIFLFFLIIVAIVTIWTFLATPIYEAKTQILVKVGRENLYMPAVPSSVNQGAVLSLNREEQINSEIQILTSQVLLEQVADFIGPASIYSDLGNENGWLKGILTKFSLSNPDPQLSPLQQAILRLQKGFSFELVKKSNVIEIRFKHQDPKMAALVLNKLVILFMDKHLEVYKTPQSYKFFQEQSQILLSRLKESERQLETFKKQHSVTSADEERKLLLAQEGSLRQEWNRTLSQMAETENRMIQIQRQVAATPKTIPMGQSTEHNPHVSNTLQARLVELQLREKELLTKYTDRSRLIQGVREEINIVRDKLVEEEARHYGKSSSGVNTTYQRLEEELYKNQAEVKALAAKKETQALQLSEYRLRLDKLNRIEADLSALQRQVEVDQQNYKTYLTKFEESRISDAMDNEKIANVTQIQVAKPPLQPVSPKVFLNLLLGLVFGTFGGILFAFLMEYLDDRLEKPEDAEEALHLPVLASIPELRA